MQTVNTDTWRLNITRLMLPDLLTGCPFPHRQFFEAAMLIERDKIRPFADLRGANLRDANLFGDNVEMLSEDTDWNNVDWIIA